MSSRMQELAAEREAVAAALREMGVEPFVFETDAGARPGSPVHTYRDELVACDVYLGIFWLGYGDYTVDEYRTAVAAGVPCLIYQKPPAETEQRDRALDEFLEKVGHVEDGHATLAWFRDTPQLVEWVQRDIDRLRTEALRNQIAAGAFVARNGPLGARLDRGDPPVVRLRAPPHAACAAPPEPFIDRERPLARIRTALADGERLVGFRGPPGIGKSALLARLAAEAGSDYPDGAICIAAGEQATHRDLLHEIWRRYYETGDTTYVPPDAELAAALEGRQALVQLDDVAVEADEVEALCVALPESAFVATGVPGEGLNPLAYVKAVTLQGFAEDEDVLTLFAVAYREPVPEAAREAVVAACRAVGAGPGQIKKLANDAWGSDEPLDAWAMSRAAADDPVADSVHAAVGADGAAALRLLTAAGPTVAMPAGVATRLGISAEQLAGLEAAGLIRAASPRFLVDEAVAGSAGVTPPADLSLVVSATAEWAASAPPDEVAAARAFVVRIARSGAAAGQHAEVLRLVRAAEGALAMAGWWGAWGRMLDLGQGAALALGDQQSEAWILHQQGTRGAAIGDRATAASLLERSLEIRSALGDADAAALTRHNLAQLAPPPVPPRGDKPVPEEPPTTEELPATEELPVPEEPPFSERPPVKKRGWLRRHWLAASLTTAALVAGGAIVATVLLSAGTGALIAAPDPVDFGSVPVGSQTRLTITLSNDGDRALEVGTVSLEGATGQFGLSAPDACAGSLSPGASCSLPVDFTPTAAGEHRASLVVAGSEGPTTVDLLGQATAGAFRLNPDAVEFGTVPAATQAEPRPFTITNDGDAALAIETLSIAQPTPAFILDRADCAGRTLAPGESCTVVVVFAPSESGSFTGLLSVEGGGQGAVAELSGFGAVGELEVIPGSVDFDELGVGNTAEDSVRVANRGNAPLELGDVLAAEGESFEVEGQDCAFRSLGPDEECTIRIAFRPNRRGQVTDAVVLVVDGEEISVAMSGVGVAGVLAVDPSAIDFGDVEVGSGSQLPVNLSNDGDADLIVEIVSSSSDVFTIDDDRCSGRVLGPGTSCELMVGFSPFGRDVFSGQLQVIATVSGGIRETATATLAGTGVEGEAFFSRPPVEDSKLMGRSFISFGDVEVGFSETRTVLVSNVGDGPLEFLFELEPAVSIPGNFAIAPLEPLAYEVEVDTCTSPAGTVISPGQSCELGFVFRPKDDEVYFALLIVEYRRGGAPGLECCLLDGVGFFGID